MTVILGITGGMASGKSTAASMLHRPGSVRFNADQAVHYLFTHHQTCIALLTDAFPGANKHGAINRTALSAILREDLGGKALKTLETIIHPFVRKMEYDAIDRAMRNRLKCVLLDIPLLFETGAEQLCDAVIVVDVTPKLQRIRAFARPGMTEEKFTALTARQCSRQERLAKADFIVTSNLGKAHMHRQLGNIMKGLMLW